MDQVTLFQHFRVVGALGVHRGPNRNKQLDAHLLQFLDHGYGVRPIPLIKIPHALVGPMEEIDNNDRDRQLSTLILPRHIQQLFLRAVAHLALPKAHGKVRHHGGHTGGHGILVHNLSGVFPGSHPIIDLRCGFSLPFSAVGTEGSSAHSWVVPEEAVVLIGKYKRNAYLGIAVGKFQNCSF